MSLELRNIHKHFGPVRANDGINLTVESGALHGLLGENGAGKSTLMKVLSGFYEADSGDIILDGRHIELGSPPAPLEVSDATTGRGSRSHRALAPQVPRPLDQRCGVTAKPCFSSRRSTPSSPGR